MDLDGILLIDKDKGVTSFEAVRKVKSLLNAKKAGHTGTLDKAASGLLIVCINRATAIQELFMGKFKRYRATVLFGTETDTLDRYGKIIKKETVHGFSDREINNVLMGFLGKTKQVPPYFSAIHKDGKRLYKRALSGEKISIDPREIEIKELNLLKNEKQSITFEVLASKGTYIRSLGLDIAHSLGTFGHLTCLRRLAIGYFSVANAVKIAEIREDTDVIPMNEALADIPHIRVDSEKAYKVYNGVLPIKIFTEKVWQSLDAGYYRVVFEDKLIALIEKREKLSYFKVFREILCT